MNFLGLVKRIISDTFGEVVTEPASEIVASVITTSSVEPMGLKSATKSFAWSRPTNVSVRRQDLRNEVI